MTPYHHFSENSIDYILDITQIFFAMLIGRQRKRFPFATVHLSIDETFSTKHILMPSKQRLLLSPVPSYDDFQSQSQTLNTQLWLWLGIWCLKSIWERWSNSLIHTRLRLPLYTALLSVILYARRPSPRIALWRSCKVWVSKLFSFTTWARTAKEGTIDRSLWTLLLMSHKVFQHHLHLTSFVTCICDGLAQWGLQPNCCSC